MKKLGLLCSVALITLGLAGCGNSNSSAKSSSSSSKSTSSKVVRKHSSNKKPSSKSNSSNAQSTNSQTVTQSSNNTGQQGKSLSEINMERGYDPNGNPLLPGQDHAAGSNPDGTPDAWVQGQINWAIQNGYLNPDGTNTPKGQAAEDEVMRNSQPGMP